MTKETKKKLTDEEKRDRQRCAQRAYRERKRQNDKDYDKNRAEQERNRFYKNNKDRKVEKRFSKYRDPFEGNPFVTSCPPPKKVLNDVVKDKNGDTQVDRYVKSVQRVSKKLQKKIDAKEPIELDNIRKDKNGDTQVDRFNKYEEKMKNKIEKKGKGKDNKITRMDCPDCGKNLTVSYIRRHEKVCKKTK